MRVVVALGGNAILRRGQEMSLENQRTNVRIAAERLAPVVLDHEVVLSHGNGPQVGLLALEGAAYEDAPAYPLDVLGAETQGMLGYLIQQELGNRLPEERPVVTILTMIEVRPDDPAFAEPVKPVGPIYTRADADALAAERGWTFRADGDAIRRVVASPEPQRVVELRQIRWMLEHRCVVVCAGGGGVPTCRVDGGDLVGVEAVIDKDHASGLLARDLEADRLLLATDAEAACVGYGTPQQRRIGRAHPDALLTDHRHEFATGSMLPKVEAACRFATATGGRAWIGSLDGIGRALAGTDGTVISTEFDGVELAEA